MRTITNHFGDAKVLDLGSKGQRGPFLVTQTGVAPDDMLARTKTFVLRPDGRWVDFNCYISMGKPEALDEIVFPGIANVMETFGRLLGRPQVLDMPVNEEGLKAWLARQETADPLTAAHRWAEKYRERRRKKSG
jgi:hypothetical protein